MRHLFSVGPFDVHFFGVMAGIAILTSIFLFLKEANRRNLDSEILVDASLYAILGIFIGARLAYVIFYNPLHFMQNPVEIFFIHHGGLSVHGGIIGGFLTAYIFSRKNSLPLMKILDTIAPVLALGLAIGRIGCDVFGAPIEGALPWGVEIENTLYHPAQIYEAILNYSLFAFLWIKRKTILYEGQLFLIFILGYSFNRAVVEFSRINPEVFGPITISHLLSGIGIVVAIYFMNKMKAESISNNSLKNKKAELNVRPIQTILITLALIIVSIFIFYFVHG